MTDLVTHDSAALSLLALGLLSEPEARAVEAHLATCTDCSHEWAQRRDTVTLLDEHVPAETFITARANPDDPIFVRTPARGTQGEAGPGPGPPAAAPGGCRHRPRPCTAPAPATPRETAPGRPRRGRARGPQPCRARVGVGRLVRVTMG